jgi:hypothetical protein
MHMPPPAHYRICNPKWDYNTASSIMVIVLHLLVLQELLSFQQELTYITYYFIQRERMNEMTK